MAGNVSSNEGEDDPGNVNMASSTIVFTQINLHHCKSATAVLAKRMAEVNTGIALIQEPWIHKGKIAGLRGCGKLIGRVDSPRTCLLVKGLKVEGMPSQGDRDLTVARIKYTTKKGVEKELMIGSAYFPYESVEGPPPLKVRNLVQECERKGSRLILGCDANAHHVVWGSSDCNRRGEELMEYLVTTRLNILNRGRKPTFRNVSREEVIDITLALGEVEVTDWRVSEEVSMSDHNHICFELRGIKLEKELWRNPKKTNWQGFEEDLTNRMSSFPRRYETRVEVDNAADFIMRAMTDSFEINCPLREKRQRRGTPWWNHTLERLRRAARRLYNKAYRTKKDCDKQAFKKAQGEYKREIELAKRSGWRNFCGEIEGISDTARLYKILNMNGENDEKVISLEDGRYARDDTEALGRLMSVHFPEAEENSVEMEEPSRGPQGTEWKLARRVTWTERIKWAIGTFEPYKAPGEDGIYPIMLQKGIEVLIEPLEKVFRSCLAMGYVPKGWRVTRVIFIPKAGKILHESPKDYRPISLTSFLLKTLERLVDRYIRETALVERPLHAKQHAYQAGKSVDTAIKEATEIIEKGMKNRGMVLAAFLDIEGAFNHTTCEVIEKGAREHGISDTLIRWLLNMLGNRRIIAKWGQSIKKGNLKKGCPQGGVISPTLWTLVVDSLIRELNEAGFHTQAYADDVLILVTADNESVMESLMKQALSLVERWCNSSNLDVCPGKTTLVNFTKRYKVKELKGLELFGGKLSLSREAKYLGVIMDSKLNWNSHIEDKCKKITNMFWACRSAFGVTWGLRPNSVIWIFKAILRPRLQHGAIAWWKRCQLEVVKKKLDKVQGLVLRGAAGAMRTTPLAALETLLGVPPLDLYLRANAFKVNARLGCRGITWDPEMEQELKEISLEGKGCDRTNKYYHFRKPFKILITDRKEWEEGDERLRYLGMVWFTDGSKKEEGVGAAAWKANSTQEIVCTLDSHATVFQAEVRAITESVLAALANGGVHGKTTICTDSQAALLALKKVEIQSKEVRRCIEALTKLGRKSRITLMWVPGHSGIRGNEKADRLANRGAEGIRSEYRSIGVPDSALKVTLQEWMKRKQNKRWREIPGLRQAKNLIGDCGVEKWEKEIWGLGRMGMRLVVGWLTGHCQLRYHLHKMGVEQAVMCRWCGEEKETSQHVICTCPAWIGERQRTWGVPILEPRELRDSKLNVIRKFIGKIIGVKED